MNKTTDENRNIFMITSPRMAMLMRWVSTLELCSNLVKVQQNLDEYRMLKAVTNHDGLYHIFAISLDGDNKISSSLPLVSINTNAYLELREA
jgi:hypothetical protein